MGRCRIYNDMGHNQCRCEYVDRSQTSGEETFWRSVTYGNSLFVAVATGKVMTRSDGESWTSRTAAANSGWWDVTFGGSLFVAVASATSGTLVMISSDGISWSSQTAAAINEWQAKCDLRRKLVRSREQYWYHQHPRHDKPGWQCMDLKSERQ